MPKRLKSFFRNFYTLSLIGFFVFTYTALKVRAIYYPTDNITNPTCAPGDVGCYVSLFPDQSGKGGKYLTTNGTNVSWADVTSGVDLTAFSGVGPISFNTANGQISIAQSSSSTNGYLSSTDWNTFNNKQNLISTGTNLQYLKGDLTLGTFPTKLSDFSNDSGFIASGVSSDAGFGVSTPLARLHVIGSGTQPTTIFQAGATGSFPITEFRDGTGAVMSRVLSNGQFIIAGHFIGRGGGYRDSNFAMGNSALALNSTGGQNTALGAFALSNNTTGSYNLGLGYGALTNNLGNFNIAIGNQAVEGSFDEFSHSTVIGSQAMIYGAGGDGNVVIGSGAVSYANGADGVFIGRSVATNFAGSRSVYIGAYTADLLSGNDNISIGYGNALNSFTEGNFNVLIGSNINSLPSTLSNHIVLADGQGNVRITANASGNVGISTFTPSHLLTVGNNTKTGTIARFQNSTGTCDINPTSSSLSCTSDASLKKNIKRISNGEAYNYSTESISITELTIRSRLNKIVPVKFNWNQENDSEPLHAGFIAQNVETVFPDLVSIDSTSALKSVNYIGFVPYLVEGVNDINIQLNQLNNLDIGTEDSLGYLINKFLSNSINTIQSIFVREANIENANIENANIEKLCVGEGNDSVCVNKEDLKRLLELTSVKIDQENNQIESSNIQENVETTDEVNNSDTLTENITVSDNEITNP